MRELSNDQRQCLGLAPVEAHWRRVPVKASPYDDFETVAYLEGDVVRKCVNSGADCYIENQLNERVTPDGRYLLPKTERGKPVLLSSANLKKRTSVGMCLLFSQRGAIDLYSSERQCAYFNNRYLPPFADRRGNIERFFQWVEQWCADTTSEDIADIERFARQPRRHVRFREGDVFRFPIDRRLYGYGRVLLNYDAMRKGNIPFWDVFMGKPVVCSVYHIVTERDDVTAEELEGLRSLPSAVIMDNSLYYGEYPVIGHIPVSQQEDYPILYGRSRDARAGEKLCFQWGRIFREREGAESVLHEMRCNLGSSFQLNCRLDILRQCIEVGSNQPYWEGYYPAYVNGDLRNPKFSREREAVARQMGIELTPLP